VKSRIAVFAMILLIVFSSVATGQEMKGMSVERQDDRKTADLYLNLSSSGTGAGFRVYFYSINPETKVSLGIQVSGVRGENEYTYFDPYTYSYYRGNRNFFTLMAPMTIGIKHRMWKNEIESDFRPYVMAEVGPVFGIAFPAGEGFNHGFRKGQGQLTGGAFFGFGVDFGDQTQRTFGVSIGMHYIAFPESLGEKKTYKGFDVRFSILNLF